MLHRKQVNWCIVVFKSTFCLPFSFNVPETKRRRVKRCLTGRQRREKDRKCLSRAGKEREMTETNFKGQCLHSPAPRLHTIFFENVRKRDSKGKSGRGGEKPIMTETVTKVHKSWLNVSLYLFLKSVLPIGAQKHPVFCPWLLPTLLDLKTGGR